MTDNQVVTNKRKIHYSKWIYLAISVLINAFIISQSALPASQSARWSNIFVRFFMNLFNGSGKDTTEVVNVEDLNLNYDTSYNLNYVDGYLDKELVIGTSKRVTAEIFPHNATNSAITFSVSDSSIAKITQNLNYAYVTGLKTGTVEVTATSLDNNTFVDKYVFEVVEKKAPVNYVTKDIEVYEDSLFYLPISYENQNYYDVDKLKIHNSNPSIVEESSTYEGLYHAINVGEDVFEIEDHSFKINVLAKSEAILPNFINISGKDSVVSNSSASYQVDVSNTTSSKEVLWSLSDETYASIDKYGLLKVKEIKEEQKVTVTATSLLDKSINISKEITLKPVTITSFELVIPYYGNHITNMPYMGETGEEIKVWMEDNTGTIGVSGVTVTSSNEEVAKVYAQGSYIYINCIKEGDTKIVVTSINNPEVSKYVDLQVTIRGVINHDNYLSFSEFVRKSIGHFLLFLVNGVFTFLFVYELNKDVNFALKKRWTYIVFTMLLGLFFAGLSELIQYFIPTRYGSFLDIGVDFLGYAIGAIVTYFVIYFIKRHKNKKKEEVKHE